MKTFKTVAAALGLVVPLALPPENRAADDGKNGERRLQP